jgi:hypothetical protein
MRPVGEAEGGFVLVGVIMFILVLTILGLSLFSLSGFESQFFERSYRDSRSFYESVGGLDRARWVLIKTNTLAKVGQSLPPGVEARAYQDKGGGFIDSLGNVAWSGADVLIRVTTTDGDVRRTVEAQYEPLRTQDYYKRLMTLSGRGGTPDTGLWVYIDNGVGDTRWTQTALEGRVWQNPASPGPLCTSFVNATNPALFQWIPPGGVPDPDVDDYFYGANGHWAGASIVPIDGTSMAFNLIGTGQPNDVGFYRTISGGAPWSGIFGPKNPDAGDIEDVQINVQGTVIWMFDRGLDSERMVRVQGVGGANDLLILVALSCDPSQVHRHTGLALFGGLDSPTVPVILVASENIKLQHAVPVTEDASSTIGYLSVYAKSIALMGPKLYSPLRMLTLQHAPNAAPDQPGGAVDRLYDLGLLPNIIPDENRDLPMRPGTWHQVALNN